MRKFVMSLVGIALIVGIGYGGSWLREKLTLEIPLTEAQERAKEFKERIAKFKSTSTEGIVVDAEHWYQKAQDYKKEVDDLKKAQKDLVDAAIGEREKILHARELLLQEAKEALQKAKDTLKIQQDAFEPKSKAFAEREKKEAKIALYEEIVRAQKDLQEIDIDKVVRVDRMRAGAVRDRELTAATVRRKQKYDYLQILIKQVESK